MCREAVLCAMDSYVTVLGVLNFWLHVKKISGLSTLEETEDLLKTPVCLSLLPYCKAAMSNDVTASPDLSNEAVNAGHVNMTHVIKRQFQIGHDTWSTSLVLPLTDCA